MKTLFNSITIFCWLIRFYFLLTFTKIFESEPVNSPEKEGYKLTFSDEFDKPIDWENKWNPYYSDNTETRLDKIKHSSSCIEVDKGLKLCSKQTDDPHFIVESGYLNTKLFFSINKGFIEHRIKAAPVGKKYWGAGWLLVENIHEQKPYAEIDIYEFMDVKDIKRGKTTCISFHLHFPEQRGKTMIGRKLRFLNLDKYYHTVSVDWTDKRIIWRLNNIPVFRVNKHIPDCLMSLIVNNYGWKECTYKKDEKAVMEVDYIRVWKKI